MGWRLRRSIKIIKGVRINVGKKGINSVSIGGKGLTTNIGKHGIRRTYSIKGTGISYSEYDKYSKIPHKSQDKTEKSNLKTSGLETAFLIPITFLMVFAEYKLFNYSTFMGFIAFIVLFAWYISWWFNTKRLRYWIACGLVIVISPPLFFIPNEDLGYVKNNAEIYQLTKRLNDGNKFINYIDGMVMGNIKAVQHYYKVWK